MKKQISWGVVLSFISQIISILVGLAYTPVMVKILGQNEYGLYQLVQSVVNYLNLMNFGFNGAYIRFFSLARAKNSEKEIANVNGMFMGCFLLIAIMCLIMGTVLLFHIDILGTQITESDYGIARKLLILMVLTLALSFPNSLFVAYMSANEKFIFQKGFNIFMNLLLPAINLPLLYMGFGSIGVVAVNLFLAIIRLASNFLYCVKKLNMKITIGFFDRRILRSLLGYTFFIFLSDLVDQLNYNVDNFLLGRLSGTVAVAIYSVGSNLKHYYTLVSWIIPEMYVPRANRIAIEEGDDKKLTEIFTKIGRYNNYVILLISTGFFLVGKTFVRLWVGEEYDLSYRVCLILMIAGYVAAIQTLGVNIQNAKNMHRMRSVVYFFVACINVISSIFLIRLWGVTGASLGTLFAIIIGNGLFMNYYYHKFVGLNVFYFWREIIQWTVPACILCGAFKLLLTFVKINSWFTLALFVILYSVIYLLLLWFIGIKSDEKKKIIKEIKRIM